MHMCSCALCLYNFGFHYWTTNCLLGISKWSSWIQVLKMNWTTLKENYCILFWDFKALCCTFMTLLLLVILVPLGCVTVWIRIRFNLRPGLLNSWKQGCFLSVFMLLQKWICVQIQKKIKTALSCSLMYMQMYTQNSKTRKELLCFFTVLIFKSGVVLGEGCCLPFVRIHITDLCFWLALGYCSLLPGHLYGRVNTAAQRLTTSLPTSQIILLSIDQLHDMLCLTDVCFRVLCQYRVRPYR